MMIPLCRHIFPSGTLCQGPAAHDTDFCRHHQVVKTTLALASQPVAYGAPPQLPFVFAEDRAAIQLNLMMVLKALNDGKIDSRTANSMNRLLNTCLRNLKAGPLVDPEAKDVARSVIRTPDGEEIAPPREAPEDRSQEETAQLSTLSSRPKSASPGLPAHAGFARWGGSADAAQRPAVSSSQSSEIDDEYHEVKGPLTDDETTLADLFPDAIARYKAAYAARVQTAIDAGLEPPAYEPWDLSKFESKPAQPDQEHRVRAVSAATAG